MHNPTSALENDTHKHLWNFDIQTDHLISARRPDLIITNNNYKKKRICKIVNFAVPADHRVKIKESEKKNKYLDLASQLKKTTQEHENDVYTNCNWCSWYSHTRINKGTGGLGNKRTSGDCPNYCITQIGQNTEKSPEDLKRLAVTQLLVKNHQR